MPSKSARSHGSLVDSAVIEVRGGHGGRGSASFRHEPFVPKGGPDGGDGGNGGSVVLVASQSVASLAPFTRRRVWLAGQGGHGAGARKEGRQGEDARLGVPVGTQVLDEATGSPLGDLDQEGATLEVARGGGGGRGNRHFVSSVRQAPGAAEPGLPGQRRTLRLELKLIADVGLVGLPNAGKSSLLAALTAARPKVAAYPFTTLDPQLGMVEDGTGARFVLADIPGLIEGASGGAGLGLRFLRHIERTRLIVYLVDGSGEHPWQDLKTIQREVLRYSPALASRSSLNAVNKVDLAPARAFRSRSRRRGVHFVSALTGEGLPGLVADLSQALQTAPLPEPAANLHTIRLPEARERDRQISVVRRSWGFELSGRRIQRLVQLTDLESRPALERFQLLLDRMGVTAALEQAGAAAGDTVKVDDLEFEYQP